MHCLFSFDLRLLFFRLADLFAEHQDQLEQDLKNLLISDDDIYDNETSSPKITRLRDEMMYCLQPGIRSNITVFDLDSETDLSQAIFQIIVQCKSFDSIRGKLHRDI